MRPGSPDDATAHTGSKPVEAKEPRGSAAGYGTHRINRGDTIHFDVDGKRVGGRVVAMGEDGATVATPDGHSHRVRWADVRQPPKADANPKGETETTRDPNADPWIQQDKGERNPYGPGKPDPRATTIQDEGGPFRGLRTAAEYQDHFVRPFTDDEILAGFGPDAKAEVKRAQQRLASIEQTIDTFAKVDPKTGERTYSPERLKKHDEIILKVFGEAKNAKPQRGEQPTFLMLGGRGGCLSADHEFLTPQGWKRIDQYRKGDRLLVFDKDANATHFEEPRAYVDLPCESFNHFQSRGLDMMLSDEHTLLYNKKYNREVWRTSTAKEVVEQHEQSAEGWDGMVPCAFPAPSNAAGVALSNDELRLMVAVCADGNFALTTTNRCRISLRRERKIARIEMLLDQCGISYKKAARKDCETEVRYSFDAPHNNKTLAAYWDANAEQLAVIAEEMLHWDGWIDQYGSWIYTSTQRGDIDFASYLFSTQGRRSSFYRDDRDGTGWKPIWRIAGAKNGGFAGMRCSGKKPVIETVPSADGRKYCFTTSTGFFITRRNDCVCVTGNSGKSQFKGMVYDPEKFVVLDADAIKGMLPEYEGWNAFQVHEESSDILEKIEAMAVERGLNLVLDATMKTTTSAVQRIEDKKDAGYRTEAHYMYLPAQESAKRAVGRFMHPGKDGKGRYVPLGVIRKNTSNERSFDAVRHLVDKWSFWDNNVPKGHHAIYVGGSDERNQEAGSERPRQPEGGGAVRERADRSGESADARAQRGAPSRREGGGPGGGVGGGQAEAEGSRSRLSKALRRQVRKALGWWR